MLSTIACPVFSKVVILYRDSDFRGVHSGWAGGQADAVEEALRYQRQFEVFHEMYKVRDFHLVLCADVWDRMGEYAVWLLKQAVAAEKAKGGFDELFPEPLAIPSPRGSRPDPPDSFRDGSPIPWVSL